MAALDSFEKSLNELFNKSAPKLSQKAKDMIVEWVPWVSLILGVFTLASVWWVWDWANTANRLADYANQLSATLGGGDVVSDRLTAGIWLGLVVLAAEALVYIMAFSPLKARKKSGWNFLFYALLLNVVYGLVIMFTNYGNFGNLIGYVIGSSIGLYFLFQIREKYVASKSTSGST